LKAAYIENDEKDPRAGRCGHNFPVNECPYRVCGYRFAVEQWEKALRDLRLTRRGIGKPLQDADIDGDCR
jgi:hypothetical protein